jgi:oligo-1,6-glucosidase
MQKKWWKESVVYQIYPRSFYDSNGDGIGDLRGIIQKLDYLKELGVDVIWLSPVYRSPNDDNGYDISDYRDIMPDFGTLADWEEMLAGMHQRGIKLVMDLVVNHTSDEHPWFVEARKSRDNPYRDYYIWRPAVNGQEPNNWKSHFSGSAWQFDPVSGEYYLHLFSKKQPDLNWENPKVRQEVYAIMQYWLQKGIDGFRMDVINMISKTPGFPDVPNSSNERYLYGGMYFLNGPRMLEFFKEMKQEVLSHYDLLTVGETPGVTTQNAIEITHEGNGCLSMVFQFEHMGLDSDPGDSSTRESVVKWKLADLKEVITRWQKEIEGKGWNSNYLNNHDQPRQVSRFGNDGPFRVESAKLLGTFVHMLQGTPYVYQGEEIGMTNVAYPSIEDYNDIETVNLYHELVDEKGRDPQAILALLHAKSRDNARTPAQWDASFNAGFTTGKPWLKVNPNYPQINVERALADPNSIFYYYKKLIGLRKSVPAVVYGTYDLILPDHPQIYEIGRAHV